MQICNTKQDVFDFADKLRSIAENLSVSFSVVIPWPVHECTSVTDYKATVEKLIDEGWVFDSQGTTSLGVYSNLIKDGVIFMIELDHSIAYAEIL